MERKTENRYINLLTDFGFKRVFGEKDIMMAFLTDLLQPKSPIADITFLDKELGGMSEYERGVVYDLLCHSEDGTDFIVEMQNRSQAYFSDRILYYLSRSFSEQGVKGDAKWNYRLTPVYGIFFLNFHLSGFRPLSVRTVQLKVDETGELFSDKLKVFTLELPDYRTKTEADCTTQIDYWLYNITNLETMTKNIPFQHEQPIFGKVGNIAELIHMTAEERQKYNISIDTYRTNLAVMQNERAEGWAEGHAEGRAEGRAEGEAIDMQKGERQKALSIAQSLKAIGMSPSQIAQLTGLDEADLA